MPRQLPDTIVLTGVTVVEDPVGLIVPHYCMYPSCNHTTEEHLKPAIYDLEVLAEVDVTSRASVAQSDFLSSGNPPGRHHGRVRSTRRLRAERAGLACQRARVEDRLEQVAGDLRARIEQNPELSTLVGEVVVPRTGYVRAHSLMSRADQPGRVESLWDIELHPQSPLLRDSGPVLTAHLRRLKKLLDG